MINFAHIEIGIAKLLFLIITIDEKHWSTSIFAYEDALRVWLVGRLNLIFVKEFVREI